MLKSVTVQNYLKESLTLMLDRPEESGLIIESISGIGPGNATINISEISSKDGGVFNSSRKQVRNIVIDLKFQEIPNLPTIEDVRHRTYKFFPLKRKVTLTFLTDFWELYIEGYVESNEPTIFDSNEGCQISILCPDPYFKTKTKQVTQSSGSTPTFEFPFTNNLTELSFKDLALEHGYIPVGYQLLLSLDVSEVEEGNSGSFSLKVFEVSNENFEKKQIFDLTKPGTTTYIIPNEYSLKDHIDGKKHISIELSSEGYEGSIIVKNIRLEMSSRIGSELYLLKEYNDIILSKEQNYEVLIIGNHGYAVKDLTTEEFKKKSLYNSYVPYAGHCAMVSVDAKSLETGMYYKYDGRNRIERRLVCDIIPTSIRMIEWYDRLYDSIVRGSTQRYIHAMNGISLYDDDAPDRSYLNLAGQPSIPSEQIIKEPFIVSEYTYIRRYLSDMGINEYGYAFDYGNMTNHHIDVDITEHNKKYISFAIVTYRSVSNLTFEDVNFGLMPDYTNYFMMDSPRTPDSIDNTNFLQNLKVLQYYYPKEADTIEGLNDTSLANYTFTEKDKNYNLQSSDGIIFGDMNNYQFKNSLMYDGTIETGFVMTIEFSHNLGYRGDSIGYIVIRDPRYYNKKMVINMDKIAKILPKCTRSYDPESGLWIEDSLPTGAKIEENLPLTVLVGQQGDILTIDTRRNHEGIYYQKPDLIYNADYLDLYYSIWAGTKDNQDLSQNPSIAFDDLIYYKDQKIPVLGSLNKDVEWFEIGPGYNEFHIYHTFHPDSINIQEDEKDLVHVNYLDVQIENDVLHEGV